MGVRTHDAAEPQSRRTRPTVSGPGAVATIGFFAIGLVLLLANGRPIGRLDTAGAAGWILHGALALAGRLFEIDATGREIVGKLVAAAFAAAAGTALFAAVGVRHGRGEGRWAGFALVLGTTLTAAAQSFSGEAPAACAVALAVWLIQRADVADDGRLAAPAGLPLALAVAFQPSTLALALVLAITTLVRSWRSLVPFLLWAAPGAALAVLGLLSGGHSVVATTPAPAGVALLFSPGKGAFVFAPVALVALVGLGRALLVRRARFWDEPPPSIALPLGCGLAFLAHLTLLVALGGWADGVFWGPRLVSPAWPVLLLFLPEGLAALKLLGSLLVLVSIAVQVLGAVSYDGRWDRLNRGRSGELDAVVWEPARSPIAFQLREGVVRPTYVSVANRRLVVREQTFVRGGTTAGFVSFKAGVMRPTGADPTMEAVRLEAGARVVADRLELHATGDGIAFRVREGSRLRRLELRVVGRGRGVIGVGESRSGRDVSWRERPVTGPFRLRFPYNFAESKGPDLIVALRSGGPLSIESLALVPPTDPENVIRLP
jgi:hypothetical protein